MGDFLLACLWSLFWVAIFTAGFLFVAGALSYG